MGWEAEMDRDELRSLKHQMESEAVNIVASGFDKNWKVGGYGVGDNGNPEYWPSNGYKSHIIFKSGRTGTVTDLPNNLLQLTKQCQSTMPCTEVLVNSKKLVQMATNNLLGFGVETGPLSLISNLFHIERNIYSANKANSKLK